MSITINEFQLAAESLGLPRWKDLLGTQKSILVPSYNLRDLTITHSGTNFVLVKLDSNIDLNLVRKISFMSYNFNFSKISNLRNLVMFLSNYKSNTYNKTFISSTVSEIYKKSKMLESLTTAISKFDLMANPTSNPNVLSVYNYLEKLNTEYSANGFSINLGTTSSNISFERKKNCYIYTIVHRDNSESDKYVYFKHTISFSKNTEIITNNLYYEDTNKKYEIEAINSRNFELVSNNTTEFLNNEQISDIVLNLSSVIFSINKFLLNYLK